MQAHLHMLSSSLIYAEMEIRLKNKKISKGFVISWITGIICFFVVGEYLGDLVRQKWDYTANNAAQQIVTGYYGESEQSLDVLFLGASTIRNGISPLQMYKEYGFTGYSRATSIQAPVISYNLLLETLEKHSLKAVVIDATTLSQVTNNTAELEGKYHEAIDYMPMSRYKWNIIREITRGGEYSIWDFLIPLYRYHDRWSDLAEQDFTYRTWGWEYPYKGQYPILKISSYSFQDDYMEEGAVQDTDFKLTNEAMRYFDEMVDVCRENHIVMVLVKTPVGSWDLDKHNMIAKYAEITGVDFIDFNMPELQKEIGFDAEKDFCDDGRHPNIMGAKKMSSYLGSYLNGVCEFEDKRELETYASWEKNCELYERLLYDRSIMEETNLISYFKMVDKPGYTVIIAAQSDTSKYFTDEVRQAFEKLGLTVDMTDESYQSYLAILSDQTVIFEQQASGKLVSFCDYVGELRIVASSFADKAIGNNSSIVIDDQEYSPQESGFNVVVYDNETGQVVARRAFNTGRDGRQYAKE